MRDQRLGDKENRLKNPSPDWVYVQWSVARLRTMRIKEMHLLFNFYSFVFLPMKHINNTFRNGRHRTEGDSTRLTLYFVIKRIQVQGLLTTKKNPYDGMY